MKVFKNILLLGLIFGFLPLVATAKLGGQNNILGKFFVSSIKGTVTCVSDSRILELKKGDTIPARGAIIDTAVGANVTLVFSNGTGVYIDEKTHFEVRRFEQEFFALNNNLRVEPSNSLTLAYLDYGRLVLSTPQLLSGTIMLYETPHALINIRGEKVLFEVNGKQTLSHIALVSGNVSVVPRGADGEFLSIGKRLTTGQEAFVKYALNNDGSSQGAVEDTVPDTKKPAIQSVAEGQAGNAPSTGYLGPTKAPETSRAAPSGPAVITETRAKIIKIIGFANARFPAAPAETALKEGDLLPKGTTIVTEAASELFLETFKGAIATLRPMSTLEIEKLSSTSVRGVVKKQTSVLKLKAGTVISTIDPATNAINDYGVRTPKGLAHASGTSFSVTVEDDGFSVTTTADSVLFTPPTGPSYSITAGNVTITPPGGQPQPPISLSQALTRDPGFAAVIQNAVTTVAAVVQNNIGGLSSDSATNLIIKVINTAAAAIPAQAASFAAQGLTAVSDPSSSTSGSVGSAVSAVTTAAVSGAPAQAAQIATAATQADPGQAVVIAASAAKAAPALAAQVAAAVTHVVTPSAPRGPSQATLETATAIASAVTSSVPRQAAPVAAAVMQVINAMSSQATSQTNALAASTIAAGVTGAAPSQAVPVATVMMKILTQISPDAPPQAVAQSAALLAASVTSVVPPQAQEVAAAVMQAIVASAPGNSSTGSTRGPSGANVASQAAGLVAAAVSEAAPGSAQAVAQAVATATNQSTQVVEQSAHQSAAQATKIGSQVAVVAQQAAQSSQQSNQASQSMSQAESLAAAASSSGSTSSSVASSSSGSASSGSASSGSSSGPSSTGAGSANGSSTTGSATSSLTGGGEGSASGGSNSSGTGGGSSGSSGMGAGAAPGATDKATSIIVTQFDPSTVNSVTTELQAAQSGQSSVQFNTDTTGPDPTVIPTPTVPKNLPVDQTSSAAVLPGG